ncbi:serine/threonine protein kinase with PASTA sensor(s) [Rhodopirellula sallentina SM41]|uniref:Serine/threonine protein kinase with PASTA sensor(S) n=2 Tax=Rhodopirellula TaxID=265488 RepID=M5TS32_9BACT|nr:serine/threonine protein kinase with PASTA sensor(s) [Rhodopirellula sallentina SM41]
MMRHSHHAETSARNAMDGDRAAFGIDGPSARQIVPERPTSRLPNTKTVAVDADHEPDEITVAIEPPESPRLITDRYAVLHCIDTGGMGIVYRAHDRLLDRYVAVKVLRPDRATPRLVDTFLREARTMGFLSHPGIPPIYETGVCENGQPFLVMKLVSGITLRSLLGDKAVERGELLQIFTDVCHTMAYAHSRGVLHLDLKPANVMVGEFGEVNVMDWGSAKHFNRPDSIASSQDCDPMHPTSDQSTDHQDAIESSTATENNDVDEANAGSIDGTPQYMSPEQARGDRLDPRADVFSLGGILCEILSGHAPYEGRNPKQIYRRAIRGRTFVCLERLIGCGVDDALIRLAVECLQVDSNQRPRDATRLSQIMTAHQASTLQSVQSDMTRFFELSPDMFCIADHNGYFVRINENFTKVLGHSRETLLSNPFLSFVHEDDRARTLSQMSGLQNGRPVVRFRNRYITAGGDYTTIEWTAKAIEGEHLIYAVARDISVHTT